MSARPCRRCKMPIDFVTGPAGAAIPVQRVQTVYRRIETALAGDHLEVVEPTALFVHGGSLWVNHFETCPYADEFRKAKT